MLVNAPDTSVTGAKALGTALICDDFILDDWKVCEASIKSYAVEHTA